MWCVWRLVGSFELCIWNIMIKRGKEACSLETDCAGHFICMLVNLHFLLSTEEQEIIR